MTGHNNLIHRTSLYMLKADRPIVVAFWVGAGSGVNYNPQFLNLLGLFLFFALL